MIGNSWNDWQIQSSKFTSLQQEVVVAFEAVKSRTNIDAGMMLSQDVLSNVKSSDHSEQLSMKQNI